MRERITIHDLTYSLCFGDSRPGLLDFGMVPLARISGLGPVFKDPQPQTTNLKFDVPRNLAQVEGPTLASWHA